MKVHIDGIIYSLQKMGGITRSVNELVKGLSFEKHNVDLYLHPSILGKVPAEGSKHEIKTFFNSKNQLLKYGTYFLDRFGSERYFNSHPVKDGVFHSTYFTYYKSIAIPQVVCVYDMIYERMPSLFGRFSSNFVVAQKKHAIKGANALLVNAEQTKKDLIDLYNIDPETIYSVHLGVDAQFRDHSKEEIHKFKKDKYLENPFILFVGKRGSYKNFNKFVLAFSKSKIVKDYDLVLVGGGVLSRDEESLLDLLKIRIKVKNFNFVSDTELPLFYSAADAFIFPSLYEGFGLPLLESMASGTTVLASNIPVFEEVGGSVPIYFDPEKDESIVAALETSFTDENRIKLGKERAKIFSWEAYVRNVIKVYEALT